MEPIRKLKIDFDKELISSIQLYLMSILNTNGIVFDVDGEVINEINTSPYCQTLRFISERKDLCLSFRWQLSNSAIHLKKPFENVCLGGLALLSRPICINENTVVVAHIAQRFLIPTAQNSVFLILPTSLILMLVLCGIPRKKRLRYQSLS